MTTARPSPTFDTAPAPAPHPDHKDTTMTITTIDTPTPNPSLSPSSTASPTPTPHPNTVTDNRSNSRTASGRRGRVTLARVIRGEWIKFRSVTSSRVTLAGAAVATVGFGMIFSATAGSDEVAGPGGVQGASDALSVALGAVDLTAMIVGVLGALLIAGEYSTGLIRTTMTAVGSRTSVVWAKAAVLATAVAVVMGSAVTLAAWLGQLVYAGDSATLAFSDPDLWQVVAGSTVYVTAISLIGLALGFILRSTAGAIGLLVGGVFIGPQLLTLLPDSFTDPVLKYLPSNAGSAIMSQVSNTELLSTGSAYAVLAAWVVGLLGLATVLVRRRDV